MSVYPPQLPDNAPFNAVQRAWVNGYLAGLSSLEVKVSVETTDTIETSKDDDHPPWHDPSIDLKSRIALAEGQPLKRKMMAVMGQLDCGQCGYLCKSYAEAIAAGNETKLNRCVPGGKATQRALKKLLAEVDDGHDSTAPSPSSASGPIDPVLTTATVKSLHSLSSGKSVKDTRHVVIDLKESNIGFAPGDSLGILPMNDPELVAKIIESLNATPTAEVGDGNGHSRTFEQALLEDKDLRMPTDALFRLLAACAEDKETEETLMRLVDDDEASDELDDADVLDVLERFPSLKPDPKPFCVTLDDLQPRLYSISSSPRLHPDEAHLTVGVTREQKRGRQRNGVASTYLAERVQLGSSLKIYAQPVRDFQLPSDDTKPIVMIGPGTGIAPFRAFLQERLARGAKGLNWLFFGNPHSETDFLYRDELMGYVATGLLTRLDTAFSRDQIKKIYVQDRILEHGWEVWRWLEGGAHIYVCGDAKHMAGEVDKALQKLIQRHGQRDGKTFLRELANAGRYQRDMY